jgi:hypothetical protein
MTQSEKRSLSQQADKAATRASSRPAWQRALAARAASESGADTEPRVNAVVVREVERLLASDGPIDSDDV